MKRTVKQSLAVALLCGVCLAGCGGQQAEVQQQEPVKEVHVFAAASLTDSLDEIIAQYEAENQVDIIPVYEASGTLKKQIEEGADCDIFISANQKHMNALEEAGMVNTETRRDLLGNALTLIASAEQTDKIADVNSLLSDEVAYIAIGEPTDVPAGQYAKEMFENLGIWEQVEPKLIFAKNVRSVLNYVDGGDADAGFVYRTDALLLEQGSIVGDAPEGSYTAVYYPSAMMNNAVEPEAAEAFYQYLQQDAAGDVFAQYGFTVLE